MITIGIHDATPEEYAAIPGAETRDEQGRPHPWKRYQIGSAALTVYRPRPE